MKSLLTIIVFSLLLWNCNADQDMPVDDPSESGPLRVSWELLENRLDEEGGFTARFRIQNTGDETLGHDWAIYYNQTPRRVRKETISPGFVIEQISGDWYRLQPSDTHFQLAPEASVDVEYTSDFWLIKEAEAPSGVYIVIGNEPASALDFKIVPFDKENQSTRGVNDKTPFPNAVFLYEKYASIELLPAHEVPPIIPRPQQIRLDSSTIQLNHNYYIYYSLGAAQEAQYLQTQLAPLLGKELAISDKPVAGPQIRLLLEPNLKQVPDAYELRTEADGQITIQSASTSGIFYGIQSLRALLETPPVGKTTETLNLPLVEISDAPRFPYRGMHLDVSRNFHSKASVLKLLDWMSFYKLNKFHFHLTDDEGWRLEIPDLPELTKVGARRGHTSDESDRLHPAYGSGPDDNSAGSGFYTRQDFIDILRYAKTRHIEVIPEFDLPGHARAAIVSMKARYKNLQQSGHSAEAEKYLLTDREDKSQYRSVQHYHDNVISVCRESTYAFLEKVVMEVKAMYEAAELSLNVLHTGGDEVPKGVWEKSPDCIELLNQRGDLKAASPEQQKDVLTTYFLGRFHEILQRHGIRTAGWEEIAMRRVRNAEGNLEWKPNPEFIDDHFLAYVWNNLWGAQDWAYQLANAGYDVVLCDVTNLYFDLAYDKSPQEPGLYWGGFVDTRKVFEFTPYDVYKSTYVDAMGNPLPLETYRQSNMERLQADAGQRIQGIQGQLWSETVRKDAMLEYYIFPKLLALAERAWASQPDWAEIEDTPARNAALEQDWNTFANALGQRELPRLQQRIDGIRYRVPPPGAIIGADGKLWVRTAFPGLRVRYTTDGSTPDATSAVYEAPLQVDAGVAQIRLQAFVPGGQSSRVVMVQNKTE